MLNLREYRRTADRLADHLPWAALVAPGVVLNKDGSFQRTLRGFAGPIWNPRPRPSWSRPARGPTMSSSASAPAGRCSSTPNAREALGYPDSVFPDAASWLVDEERRAGFEAGRRAFREPLSPDLTSGCRRPISADSRRARAGRTAEDGRAGARLAPGAAGFHRRDRSRARPAFAASCRDRARSTTRDADLPARHDLDRRHRVAVPETPMYLDGLLADTPLTGGLEPMLGDQHLRTLTVLGFPNTSRPGILDALNHQGFAYRWVTRFIALDKTDAAKVLTKIRRQWFNKRKSIVQILREVMYNQPVRS
jgi:hypothetical protein